MAETGGRSTTLAPIEFNRSKYRDVEPYELVDVLSTDLKHLRDQRFGYFDKLRERSVANELRRAMVRLAVAASIVSIIAMVVRTTGLARGTQYDQLDIWMFAFALILYGVLAAIALADRTNDTTARYMRAVGTLHAIRDLWTTFELAMLKQSLLSKSPDNRDPAAKQTAAAQIVELGSAFCKDLDKITSDEFGEWKTEFVASIAELDKIAADGIASSRQDVETSVEAHKEALAEAKAAAEAAEKAAKEAADAAKAAVEPALLNIELQGAFDGDVSVSINGDVKITTTKKKFAIERVSPGNTRIEATATTDGGVVSSSHWTELKPGIQKLTLTLE